MITASGFERGLSDPKMPRSVVVTVLVLCALPFLGSLVGLDLGLDIAPTDRPSSPHDPMPGGHVHILLGSSAFSAALFAVFLAILHYRLMRGVSTLIIGVTLFASGALDGFHILAGAQLLDISAHGSELIPFTWVLSRTFHALLMILGVLLVLWHLREPTTRGTWQVAGASVVLGLLAYAAVHILGVSFADTETVYPDSALVRPYDLIPLALFALAGLVFYRLLYRTEPSALAAALVLSAVPAVVGQLHLVFGARTLFDHDFNSAHLLEILAYAVPSVGLALDYLRTHRERELALWAREQANEALRASEARVRAIVDTAVDAVITIDEHGVIHTFNPAAEKIFGHRADEVVGQSLRMLLPEPYESAHEGYIARYLEAGKPGAGGSGIEVEGKRKGGKRFPMELRVAEMKLGESRRFVGMARDITQRKHMERMKDEFISTVSHELRTPLTSIRGSLGLVVGGAIDAGSAEHDQLLAIALNNTERLVRLINDILDVEKIRSGKMRFNLRPLEVLPLLRQAVAANGGYAETYGVTIEIDSGHPGVWVMADRDRLMQVLTNLLSNAIKFSPRGKAVRVSMDLLEDGVQVAVQDEGPGIPEEFRQRIFERFTQAETSASQRKEGTGLGLHLCRSIIRKLGGTIGFDTETGVGTTFYFTLREQQLHARSLRAPTASESRPCILICESDPDLAQLLTHILSNDGLDAHIASTATHAHNLLLDNHYDAVTVDLRLPEHTGVAMIRRLRTDEHTRALPIVVISASVSSNRESMHGDALNLVDWLQKPADRPRLEAALARGLQREDGHRPVILQVEHEPAAIELTRELVDDRADITCVQTLAEARRRLARARYDMLILDLDMPDGRGEELLALLDIDERLPVPVLLFSDSTQDHEVAERLATVLSGSQASNAQILEKIRLALD